MKFLASVLFVLVLFVGCASNSNVAAEKALAKVATAPSTKSEAPTSKKASSTGAERQTSTEHTCTCTKGKDVRTFKIEPGTPSGCKATYTAKGTDKVIANAVNESKFCEGKVEKVKETLKAAGYTCE